MSFSKSAPLEFASAAPVAGPTRKLRLYNQLPVFKRFVEQEQASGKIVEEEEK